MVMDCGHNVDALVWDDDTKKSVCGACRTRAAGASYLRQAFAANEAYLRQAFVANEVSVAMEATPEECLHDAITTWKRMNGCDPARGLDKLMGVVESIYGVKVSSE